jgi:hypothetical protein
MAAASKAPESNTAKVQAFKFKLETVKDIPVIPRASTVERPFPFDEMNVSTNNMLPVPLEYWTEARGMKGDAIKPAAIKDRIRRSFYGWQKTKGKETERKNLTIALSDQYDPKTKKYTGVHVYLTTKTGNKSA